MAKVLKHGLISGTFGDKTYVVVNGKQYIRSKSTLTKEKMKANPKYQNFFNQALKTGIAGKYLALMYQAFGFELKGFTDKDFKLRLLSEFRTHIPSEEHISQAPVSFNSILKTNANILSLNRLITNTAYRPTIASESNFNIKTRKLTISGILLLTNRKDVNNTHFRIRLAMARIDFDNLKFDVERCQSDLIEFKEHPLEVSLKLDRIPQSNGILCYTSIIEHGYVYNDGFYPYQNSRSNNVHLQFLID